MRPGWLADYARNLAAGAAVLCFLRAGPDRFASTAGHLVLLVLTGLLLNLAAAFAFVGSEGRLNPGALPSLVFGVLLVLLAAHAIGAITRERRPAMLIPVAVASASVSLNVVADIVWLGQDRGWLAGPAGDPMTAYYVLFAWWSGAMLVAVARLSGMRSPLPALVFAVLVLLPTWYVPSDWLWTPAYDQEEGAGDSLAPAVVEEALLYSQPRLLDAALAGLGPQRPGIADLYFVAFAPFSSQDVFMKEVESVRRVVDERFGVGDRSLLLVSNPALLEVRPVATLTSLRRALRAVGERIDPGEDLVLLHVTTHGSEAHELSVDLPPLRLDPIRPADLRAALDDAGIRWRIVVVSACYSGGFIDALEDSRTMVVTAADARHTSFGCGNDSDYTYFSRAFYEEALRRTWSFPRAFALARESVSARERREKLEASNPQLFVGDAMASRLESLARDWEQRGIRP